MRKFFIILICAICTFGFSNSSFSQIGNRANCIIPVFPGKLQSIKSPIDTLRPASCLTGTPVLYDSAGIGYICGNNSYGDLAKAQEFINSASINVIGCLFWAGAKQINGTIGTILVNLYKMDSIGTTTLGYSQPCPGTVLSTVTRTMDLIDTSLNIANGLNAVDFASPISVTGNFALGLDFTYIGDDTIGIVSTTDGDATTEHTFDKWADGAWSSMKAATDWGMSFDMFIYAVVDEEAGVNDNYFFDGIKLSQNQPNPATTSTLIQYDVRNNSNVSLEVYDATGKLVLTMDEGEQPAGRHNILIDAGKLQSGSYFYSLKADNHRLTKKMVIE
jgi:hypothetical protein